ncbi:Hypp8843 [Branchiostoma lanceolatum]|uniref:Hypp8843 protein n=1 Tax=Branchiostoma lanceolatum TaxID=7740 RepID=A0A8K0EGR4_BRALA|nr:Hypp8843 [Branchiostoma lanceolatum]
MAPSDSPRLPGYFGLNPPTVKQNTCNSVKVISGEWLLYNEPGFQGSCVQLPLAIEPVPYPTAESIGYNLIGHQDTPSKLEWGGRYAWQLYPTGDPDFGYPWHDNKPLIVYPGKDNDILDVRTIPGYNEDRPLKVVLVQPVYLPCPCPGKK